MRKKQLTVLFMSLLMTSSILGGCGNASKPSTSTAPSAKEVVTDDINATEETQPSQEAIKEPVQETTHPEESKPAEEEFSFADVKNLAFDFSSGVGAWMTELRIKEDGSFKGNYHDSDMGDTGEGYPNGIVYQCTFKGKFSNLVKVNDYTYKMQLESIETERKKDEEEIVDGVKYIYSDPYGLDNAKDIYIYLPDAPIKNLPEQFMEWMFMKGADEKGDGKLPFYGLYNEAEGQGWSSYEATDAYPIDVDLKEIEKESAKIDKKLEGGLPESEMKSLASDQYKLWDDELNAIWGLLKNTLDEAEMEKIKKEEREWIVYRDKEIKKAGDEVGGGSLQLFVENTKGAELTKERVYELAKIVRSWK